MDKKECTHIREMTSSIKRSNSANMDPLLENALNSLRVGVEDFAEDDPARLASAVRNVAAGVLLLAKYAIAMKVGPEHRDEVLAAKVDIVPDGTMGVAMEKSGNRTIDFHTLCERAKAFGVPIDRAALQSLNSIRNQIEHLHTSEPRATVMEAISKSFTVCARLFDDIDEDPAVLLHSTWPIMLNQNELYEAEAKAAQASFAAVEWYGDIGKALDFECEDCGGNLIVQQDIENTSPERMELKCRACSAEQDLHRAMEAAVERRFGVDAYINAKEGGEPGPIHNCPACGLDCLLDYGPICLACGEEPDYTQECIRCYTHIPLSDALDGLDEGLCSYCTYRWNKVMSE